MFGIHDLGLFIVSGLLLNIMPGPDSLLIMARSAAQGWRAGVAAALGIGTGTMVHVLAAAVGLSALLATSATAFTVVKWVGAAYIVWCGIGMLRARLRSEAVDAPPPPPPLPLRRIYAQGFLTNVLNPKVALFFLAFVPQFIDADATNKPLAFVILGCIFNFNGMLWCNGLALFTAFASARLKVKPLVALWLNRVTGSLFLVLGARLALADRH
ncbi:threonine/homoserine/homoserine lactone efflux protein [Pseudoduganella flava]|uniref:LysE family transporter n=1 Tax=Pseudoduganella flava TaxID=871742 RepID=A0A562PM06_9BURK|nr:LysE family translocator [Pseudoduganella flava]QGZ41068.1 LysE family transporter [Pseudoduganella flava]TWI45230.1 threonine/homoserine/homoserine lactone efflux protein [Pseudoduganella flava]